MSDTLKTAAAAQLGVDPSTIRSVRMAANPSRPDTNCEITQAITGSKVWIHLDEPTDTEPDTEPEPEPDTEPEPHTTDPVSETEYTTSYEDMTVAELDEILKALDQPTTGNKADKVARLTAQGDTPT